MSALFHDKICCLIITYNPGTSVLGVIDLLLNDINYLIVVDNNSQGQSQNVISHIADDSRVRLLHNQENVGVAKALNQGVAIAKNMGYEWVLTFDQDTRPLHDIFKIITDVYTAYPEKHKIGAIGVNFINAYSKSYCHVEDNKEYKERDYLITSGCLLSIDAFYYIGGFREDLFIDNVDIEYSLRLKRHGKVSIISRKYGMSHKVGSPKMIRLFGVNIISSNHDRLRRYYMARNHMILVKEYLVRNPYFIAKASYFFILDLIKLLLVDDDKLNKISASVKGIIEGVFYSSKKRKLFGSKYSIVQSI